MWNARAGDAAGFAVAKIPALAGCGVAMLLLFGGFIVIGETWFEMWRSDVLRDLSLQSAFRYGAMVTLIALYVGCLDD
jgi:predicted small integral membrane protein